jgi:glutamate-1-semialdehyde 2,1-aminomutase
MTTTHRPTPPAPAPAAQPHRERRRSEELFARASRVMPGGVSSPVRAFKAVGGAPLFVERAEGAWIVDADGNRFIDLVGSWGPAIVGHAHPDVLRAVTAAARNGLSFGACSHLEAELAERIIAAFPAGNIEMVRFVSSGTEACMSAARLARGATGRTRIVKFEGHYHGHADNFLVAAGSGAATFGTPNSPGVPAATAGETILAPFNDPEAIRSIMSRHGHEIAAIFVEPLAGNMGFAPPLPGFHELLRTLCDQHGSLLVFDEVMTGFRVAWGGYQNIAHIRPDLTCFGKVIGGGLPVAAYAGPKSLMNQLSPAGPIYQAGTLSGNPLGMAAGLETLRLCAERGFYENLHERSTKLAEGLAHVAAEAGLTVATGALGGMLGIAFAESLPRDFAAARAADRAGAGPLFADFFQAMLARGVWLPPSYYEAMFISAAHDDAVIDAIIAAAAAAFKEIV